MPLPLTYDAINPPPGNQPFVAGGYGNAAANTTAATDFQAWAIANQGVSPPYTHIILNFPAGEFDFTNIPLFGSGIKDLEVAGGVGGGTTSFLSTTTTGIEFTAVHLLTNTDDPNATKDIDTCLAGALKVVCLTLGDAASFNAGDWTMLMGINLQATGWPPNPAVTEYLQVASADGATGEIFFTSPLRYGYESGWPDYALANNSPGPARIMKIESDWDAVYYLHDFTVGDNTVNFAMTMCGRKVTIENVTFFQPTMPTNSGINPSACRELTITNCNSTSPPEPDKCITSLTVDGGTWANFSAQSTSLGDPAIYSNMIVTNSNPNNVPPSLGASGNTIISNCTIDRLCVSPSGYGVSKSLRVINSTAGQLNFAGSSANDSVDIADGWSISGGTIRCTKSQLAGIANMGSIIGWARPNFVSSFGYMNSGAPILSGPAFLVTDLIDNGLYVDITTNLGNINSLPTVPGTPRIIFQAPCADVFFSGCSGDASGCVIDLSQPKCQHRPFGKASRRRYYRITDFDTNKDISIWGSIVWVKISVDQPYTGGDGDLSMNVFGPSGIGVVDSSGSVVALNPTIDLLVTGTREITPSSFTAQSVHDSLTSCGYSFIRTGTGENSAGFAKVGALFGTISPSLSRGIVSGAPDVTIEIITDQAWLPTINSLTPNSGIIGTSVAIDGHSFAGVTSVTFAGVPALFSYVDDFTINATAPGGSGLTDVVITTPNGTSLINVSDQFLYTGKSDVLGVALSEW